MKVAVIGAGVVGITTAYFLRQHGMDVTVFERASGPAQGGASYGNGGYYQASAPDPWNAPGAFRLFSTAWLNSLAGRGDSSAFAARSLALPGLFSWGQRFLRHANQQTFLKHLVKNRNLAQYSLTVVATLNNALTLDYSWSGNGSLIVFRNDESLQRYVGIADYVRDLGSNVEVLEKAALLNKEPSLNDVRDELCGAVHFPDDQSGDSRAFCEQLGAIATDQGVEFNYLTDVKKIAKEAAGFRLETDNGAARFNTIVIAAGAHSKTLVQPLGVHLPVAPAKGFSISVPMGGWNNRPTHVIADMGTHAGVNPMGDVLRVAGTAEFCGFNEGVSDKRSQYMMGLLRQLFPTFAKSVDLSDCDPWGGHRPLSADGISMIGATSVKGLYVNTGHGGLGWTQAPGSAKALADEIAGVRMTFDLSDFSVERFN